MKLSDPYVQVIITELPADLLYGGKQACADGTTPVVDLYNDGCARSDNRQIPKRTRL